MSPSHPAPACPECPLHPGALPLMPHGQAAWLQCVTSAPTKAAGWSLGSAAARSLPLSPRGHTKPCGQGCWQRDGLGQAGTVLPRGWQTLPPPQNPRGSRLSRACSAGLHGDEHAPEDMGCGAGSFCSPSETHTGCPGHLSPRWPRTLGGPQSPSPFRLQAVPGGH